MSRLDQVLLSNIQEAMPDLESLLADANDHWGLEDGVYRFYHQSFKVYDLQYLTANIVTQLIALDPKEVPGFDEYFQSMIDGGTGKRFELEHNQRWPEETRPIVEAAFHTHYFLQQAVKYGREYAEAPNTIGSGWAALLELFKIRYR